MSRGRKIILMLVSLLGAVVLWLYVVNNIATETTRWIRNIPVKIDGAFVLGDRYIVTSQGRYYVITDQNINTVALEISTSRANMNKLNAGTIRVTANTSRASISEPGEYELDWSVSYPNTVRYSDVQIIDQSKEKVKITVDELISDQEIEIEFVPTGSRGQDYVVETESAVLEPASLFVTGPKAEVDQIARAVVTYDITDLNEDVETTLPVKLLDAEGQELSLSALTTVDVSETQMTLPVNYQRKLSLALELIEGPGVKESDAHIEISPEYIVVKGPRDVMEQLEEVLTLDSVDLNEIPKSWSEEYELNLPIGVINVSGESEAQVRIRLTISDDTVKVKEKNIQIVNPPPANLYAEITTREVQVPVRGKTAAVREIVQSKQNEIIIEVDLSECDSPGTYTVPGRVINTKYPNISVPETVEIGVVITNEAPASGGATQE